MNYNTYPSYINTYVYIYYTLYSCTKIPATATIMFDGAILRWSTHAIPIRLIPNVPRGFHDSHC